MAGLSNEGLAKNTDMDTILSYAAIGVIIPLVQLLKQLTDLSGRVWLLVSFGLGILSQVAIDIILYDQVGGSVTDWIILLGAGLITGLAASKTYDEVVRRSTT